ncbi:MAG TPA: hypothetical protein VKV06_08900 [Acidimicrobiales bacterium]|nr:hypothetical protein [Acidimicrobiales bacterium]
MRDDEILDRLRRALRTEADMLTPGHGTPRVTPVSASRRRRLIGTTAWLGVAGLAVVAAAATIVLTVANRPSSHNVDVGTPPSAVLHTGRDRFGTTMHRATQAPAATPKSAPGASAPSTSAPNASAAPTTVAANAVPATSGAPAGRRAFVPLSATFVSPDMGWLLGVSSCGRQACLQLGDTIDRGRLWTTRRGPSVAGLSLPSASNGGAVPDVQIRFANPSDGWIFGNVAGSPILYSTTDGGGTWTAQSPVAQWKATSIEDLETSAGRVQLLYLTSGGAGMATARVGSADPTWSATPLSTPSGAPTSAQLVMQHGVTWVVASRQSKVVGGAIWSNDSWQTWTDLPCAAVGGPVVLAASDPTHVVAVCGPAGAQQVEVSADGGASWHNRGRIGSAPAVQAATSAPGSVVAGTASGAVVTSTDGGSSFATTLSVPAGRTRRILQVGFEDNTQGILITATATRGALYTTSNAGQTWSRLPLPAPPS